MGNARRRPCGPDFTAGLLQKETATAARAPTPSGNCLMRRKGQ